MRPLRVLLDVNVWIANLMAADKGRQDTTTQRLVSMVSDGKWGYEGREAQLIISLEMMETMEHVLIRLGYPPENAQDYAEAVSNIAKYGPNELDPYLILGGREQLAMHDAEDAGVLTAAIAANANLLVTDNLRDFTTKDSLRIDTMVVKASSGKRQLEALRYQKPGTDLIIAHPFDVMAWLERRLDFEPDALWREITRNPGSRP